MTHQTRYLDLVLAGLARQTRRADHIVVTCDTDRQDIGDLVRSWAPRVGVPISWVRRAHHGIARCAQVRNNALRHLVNDLGVSEGLAVQLDGDMLASPGLLEGHARLAADAELVYAHRVDVPEGESGALCGERVLAGEQMPAFTDDARQRLAARQRRARRQLVLRRLRLGPLHKPKLLGSNWSGRIGTWLAVNGFDEHFQGWGFLDDEFARRAARAGARCALGLDTLISFHLYHPTRQPSGPMTANPNYARFADRSLPVVAEHGLTNPLPQHPVRADVFAP
ncbi:MAG: hypothetical protein IBJ11_10085 [Phycisphaerales bacterium]|nr:hypothetical protein [Phycisphaerales bacterium]